MQIYWWQLGGSYLIGRYVDDGRLAENIATDVSEGRDALAICTSAMRGCGAKAAR